jgi:hypothetical protein
MPACWLQGLLEAQAAALPSYPTASLVLLLRATARSKVRLPAASAVPLLSALQQQLRQMPCRDLAEVIWSLGVLGVRPPQQFMTAAMAASGRQLSGKHLTTIQSCLYSRVLGQFSRLRKRKYVRQMQQQHQQLRGMACRDIADVFEGA